MNRRIGAMGDCDDISCEGTDFKADIIYLASRVNGIAQSLHSKEVQACAKACFSDSDMISLAQ